MKTLIKLLLAACLGWFVAGVSLAQAPAEASDKIVAFKFQTGDDRFFVPYAGNGAELDRLYALVDEYRTEITAGGIPIYVEGYCASLPTERENRHTAFVRANRVKSELITHKELKEENFITKNYTTAYEGRKDIVIVTFHIPAKVEELDSVRVAQKRREREAAERAAREQEQREQAARERAEREQAEAERAAREQAERDALLSSTKSSASYRFDLRTNLLYDAFLLPTLGVEWRINRHVGLKVDGSRSWWGNKNGKVQKIWLLNPELRWYLLRDKRFYAGASANFGAYNIYKYMLGNLLSDDTGYQGKLWGAGLTVGYQLPLSRRLSLDFNLGLGYTRLEYDTFTMIDRMRAYKEKDLSKDCFRPTQAGISLVWTIGDKNK